MPVTNFDLRNMNNMGGNVPDVNSILGINNSINQLIGDDEEDDNLGGHSQSGASEGVSLNNLLHMDRTSDGFPILGRRHGDMSLSSNSSALDLNGLSSTAGDEAQSNGWPSFGAPRHTRAGQSMSSLPMSHLRGPQGDESEQGSGSAYNTPPKKNNRHSMQDHQFANFGESKRSSFHAAINGVANGMPKLQSSYSTNDIPTVKNTQPLGDSTGHSAANLTHAEQHLHNHNASLGRVPMNAGNRHSRDMSGGEARAEDKVFRPLSSVLQANAAPFGPTTSTASNSYTQTAVPSNSMGSPYAQQPYYGGYGMANGGSNGVPNGMANGISNGMTNGMSNPMGMMNMGINNMSIASPPPAWNQMGVYPSQYGYNASGFQSYGNTRYGQQDSQARVMAARRNASSEDNARYANYKLENMHGQIYELCKDQHGCRFLQRKLEEQDPQAVTMIFEETKDYVVELMTDPFGNYLCQKLLEFSNDEQRTVLIKNAAPQMVKIALNQHGTRALQKMIEFITTHEQIEIVKDAINSNVVDLIQDLNGNHVIQKCLNHLKPAEAEFIFIAVSTHCLTVGTHRHGCCVLQRCIDHATGDQKSMLVNAVIDHAYVLVQDPFGNYVVQYILDLNNPDFTRPLCIGFCGRIVELSKQKFSSNVIEKCLRVADNHTRNVLIEEFLIAPSEVDKLLRDHYANYVCRLPSSTVMDQSRADSGI
jgi:hypothetical protein